MLRPPPSPPPKSCLRSTVDTALRICRNNCIEFPRLQKEIPICLLDSADRDRDNGRWSPGKEVTSHAEGEGVYRNDRRQTWRPGEVLPRSGGARSEYSRVSIVCRGGRESGPIRC